MSNATDVTAADVRAWAILKGLAKATRGKLSRACIEAYNKAHPSRKYS